MRSTPNRNQQLVLRLLGMVGFVLLLFFLPAVGQRCGVPAITPTAPVPDAATATLGSTPVVDSPLASPTSVIDSPLPSPTSPPTATTIPTATQPSTEGETPTATPVPRTATATATLVPPTATGTATPVPPTPAATQTVPAGEDTPTPTPTRTTTAAPGSVPVWSYVVLEEYPHDVAAFTQGLVYEDGFLYEGTGLRGRSSLRRVVPETGEVVQSHVLADQYFGEGITIYWDRIYQLTWQSNVGFIYDWETFEPIDEFSYPTEGWGLTHDGEYLIMSDGTATLHFLDPETLEEVWQVEVRDESGPVWRLNELEYIYGEVYANVWQTDLIARIDPDDGMVLGWIDLTGLLPTEERVQRVDVLNGIAYDLAGDRLFVTGKLWPKMYVIDLVPKDE